MLEEKNYLNSEDGSMSEDSNVNEENQKLNEENMDDVSGGAIFYAGRWAGDKNHKWEVIDDETGNVLGRYSSKAQALTEAKDKGSSNVRYYRMSTINKKRDAYKQHDKFKNEKQSNTGFINPF